jgi:hypothetical protein
MRKRVRLTFGKVPERVLHSDATERCKCSTGEPASLLLLISGARKSRTHTFS